MGNGLSKQNDIQEIADLLSETADAMHEGAMAGIKARIISQEEAMDIAEQEQALRSQANSIYLAAAKLIVSDLDAAQSDLVEAINHAKGPLKRMEDINKFLSISADMISLAGAILESKPNEIIASLKSIRNSLTT